MGEAKRIRVEPIAASDANRIVRALHYSGKVVNNSQVHFGVFMDGRCGGALQFGPSLDKRKMLGLVEGTGWNEFIELNRMALAAWLPRNSESRVLSICMMLLRRNYPWLKWVVSFADGTQSGDGTIYRASGFVLTGITKNGCLWKTKNGKTTNTIQLHHQTGFRVSEKRIRKGMFPSVVGLARGFQLRYVYFLDPSVRERLTVPVLPFSEIERLGAGMYLGKPRVGGADSGAAGLHPAGGGASPTPTLPIPPA